MKTGEYEQMWAKALVGQLVANKAIELVDGKSPINDVAAVLPNATGVPDDANTDHWDDLGEKLLDALVDATAVDEVFVDEEELVVIARATRPS
jgi:hypothetical protein